MGKKKEETVAEKEAMDTGVHPLVSLLVARMESHPEEFATDKVSRWTRPVQLVEQFGIEQEKRLLGDALRKVAFDRGHQLAMDELLNGEERRREQQKAAEEQARTKVGGIPPWANQLPAFGGAQNAQGYQQYLPMQAEIARMQHEMDVARTQLEGAAGLFGSSPYGSSGGLWGSLKKAFGG